MGSDDAVCVDRRTLGPGAGVGVCRAEAAVLEGKVGGTGRGRCIGRFAWAGACAVLINYVAWYWSLHIIPGR